MAAMALGTENMISDKSRGAFARCGRRCGIRIHEGLKGAGYSFECEIGSSEDRVETWINPKAGMGVSLSWFRL